MSTSWFLKCLTDGMNSEFFVLQSKFSKSFRSSLKNYYNVQKLKPIATLSQNDLKDFLQQCETIKAHQNETSRKRASKNDSNESQSGLTNTNNFVATDANMLAQETQVQNSPQSENKICKLCKRKANKECERNRCKSHCMEEGGCKVHKQKIAESQDLLPDDFEVDLYTPMIIDTETSVYMDQKRAVCQISCYKMSQKLPEEEPLQEIFNSIIMPRSLDIDKKFGTDIHGLDIDDCKREGITEWELLHKLDKILPKNIIFLAHNGIRMEKNVLTDLMAYWRNDENTSEQNNTKYANYTALNEQKNKIKQDIQILNEAMASPSRKSEIESLLQQKSNFQTTISTIEQQMLDLTDFLRFKCPKSHSIPKDFLTKRNIIFVDTVKFIKKHWEKTGKDFPSNWDQQTIGKILLGCEYKEQHSSDADCEDLYEILMGIFKSEEILFHEIGNSVKSGESGVFVQTEKFEFDI